MMLKSVGLDPDKLIAEFEAMKKGVTETLQSIDKGQKEADLKLIAIQNAQRELDQRMEEVRSWITKLGQYQLLAQPQATPLSLPHTAPAQPKPPQKSPPENPPKPQ